MIAMEDVTRKLLHISMALTQFRTRLLCLLTASNSSWQDMLSVPRRKWWSSRKREEMQTSLLIRPVQETHKDNMYPLSNRISFMSIWSLHMPCRRQYMGMSISMTARSTWCSTTLSESAAANCFYGGLILFGTSQNPTYYCYFAMHSCVHNYLKLKTSGPHLIHSNSKD